MKARSVAVVGFLCWCVAVLSPLAVAQPSGKKPPAPLNKGVTYEPYPDTDVAQVVYLTSRQEFHVGHWPYQAAKFHVAEYVLLSEHLRKYLRPDLRAEIQLAPPKIRNSPNLMGDKNFQIRWKELLSAYDKLMLKVREVKAPPSCKTALEAFRSAFEDEWLVAKTISKRMSLSQEMQARDLVCSDLSPRLHAKNPDAFGRLCEAFKQDGNLASFYTELLTTFVDAQWNKAKEEAEKAMLAAGVSLAVSAGNPTPEP
jgi:hypothetical protein